MSGNNNNYEGVFTYNPFDSVIYVYTGRDHYNQQVK